MAVRPLVNIERLTTAYVNSVDGSMTYESGKAYEANTTVSYNGSLYTATVDIEDTDTDTPDAAPDKWSMTINAPASDTSGDISALAARVTALENKVSNSQIVSFNNVVSVTGTGTETYKELLDSVVSSLADVLSSLDDNQFVLVQRITIAGVTTLIPKAFYYDNTSDLHILSAINIGVTNTQLVFWSYTYPADGSVFNRTTYNMSTNVATFEDTGSVTPSGNRTITIMYDIYERII